MKAQRILNWKNVVATGFIACAMAVTGCTEEEAEAVLAGVQVVADELDSNDDEVSFRDWLSDELDD